MVSEEEDPPSSDHPEFKLWKQRNQKAIAFIGLGLADTLIHHVDFGNQIWSNLESIFGNKITNSKVFLKLKFYDLKMADSDEFSHHLAYMSSLITQLASLKSELDNEDKMAVLMMSMKNIPRFESTLEVLLVATTTFEDMIALLLEKDRRNKEEKGNNSTDNAFVSS